MFESIGAENAGQSSTEVQIMIPSRKIERATYDSLAFRYIACNRHSDHDTLANFRKRFAASRGI